ncbi:MAG: hypothetical protein WCC69_10950 [Pirellulales bacterium]
MLATVFTAGFAGLDATLAAGAAVEAIVQQADGRITDSRTTV